MAQVYGAGGKTLPKKGRLGTGSYWPRGTPIAVHPGNSFGKIVDADKVDFPQLTFGQPSRAGISTQNAQSRVQTPALHPNKATYDLMTQQKMPGMVQSSIIDNNNLQPVPIKDAVLLMPHERNTNTASGEHKKPKAYRTVFGASSSMAVDTAFERKPTAQYKRQDRPDPKGRIEGPTRVNVINRSFARVDKPVPVRGGLGRIANPRTPPPSFSSHGNHWSDPHNSFIAGHTTIAGQGTGRWQTIKRSVV
jgi:hypothetical protein